MEDKWRINKIGDDFNFIPKKERDEKLEYERLLNKISNREKKIESDLVKIGKLKKELRKLTDINHLTQRTCSTTRKFKGSQTNSRSSLLSKCQLISTRKTQMKIPDLPPQSPTQMCFTVRRLSTFNRILLTC